MKKKFRLFFALFFLGIGLAMAQTQVQGVVVDESGDPVIGASIQIKGTARGVVTDINGEFSLSAPPNGTLVVSYVGMETIEVAVSPRIRIRLTSDAELLDEVVVTAMGISRDKKALGYALQEIKSDDLTKAGQMNIATSLSGKIAGIQITSQGGQIGASQNIVIRGNSSFGSNQPLIVVDGVPMVSESGSLSGSVNLGSGLNDINPEDIESISVLKGGSAALYGMRAGNGVIIITTKSGKKNQGVVVSYDTDFTVDKLYNLPRFQNKYGQGYYGSEYDWKGYNVAEDANLSYQEFAEQFGFSYYDGDGNGVNDNADESWGPRLDIGLRLPQFNSPVVNGVRQATDWVSNPNNVRDFFETGYSTNHTISLRTATNTSSTRASLSFRDQKGTTPNTDQKRYAATLNTNMAVSKYVDFDLSMNYIRTNSNNLPGTGYDGRNVLQSLTQWFGRQIDVKDLKENYDQKDAAGNYTHYNWQHAYATNPYWVLYKNLNKYTRNRVYGKSSVWVKPTSYLKFEGRIGLDYVNSNQFSNVEWSVDYPDGYFRDYNRNSTEINADFIGYFNKEINDFSINVLAGANYRDYDYATKTVGADELTVPGLYTVANVKGVAYAAQDHLKRRSNSLYSNISLGWKNQLYVDMSARNDWDSTIKDDFFYPSVSGSWIATETFSGITASNIINFLKLRGGVAKIGSATDPYRANAYYSVLSGAFDGTALYYNPITYPPSHLRPEMVRTWELGAELRMFSNRLRLDAAYYQKFTTDQIMTANISTATGYQSMLINAGKISNKGLELQVSGDIIKNLNGFNWTATLNWSKDRSRIEELYTDPNTGQKLKAYEIGSNWSVYNYAIPGKSWGTLVGNGYVYNDDGSILIEDGHPVYASSQEIGDVTPDWLAGLRNEFTYKDFTLGFLLDYRKGGDIFSVSQMFGSYTGLYDYTATGDIRENGVIAGRNVLTDKVFKTADGEINDVAVNAEDFFGNFYTIREMSVFDGSYLKLREAYLTYSVPKKVLQKSKVFSAANISLIGTNLALLWVHKSNLTHLDPESTLNSTNSGIGFESNSYPPSRSIGLKIGVTF